MTDYETVLHQIEHSAVAAPGNRSRELTWLTDAHTVGVARDQDGRVEVFLAGPELNPVSAVVAEAVEFHNWHREGGSTFEANRILLPALGHFDQVAAFICTELLRNGADTSIGEAFASTEPIIALAIERLRLSDQAIVGLAGELLLLEALCRSGVRAAVGTHVDSWMGWRRSSRDFVLGSTGIEVKTTTRGTSSHYIEGVHQVEPSDGSDGEPPERRLYLVSIGLNPTPPGDNTFSIPELVDRIVEHLAATDNDTVADRFLSRVVEYGTSAGNGYDHRKRSLDPAYTTAFNPVFFRGYDMTGEDVRVLRRRDISLRSHVDVSFVKFRIDLPAVAGPRNPVNGPNQVARMILGSAESSGQSQSLGSAKC